MLDTIHIAHSRIHTYLPETPFEHRPQLSKTYNISHDVFLKREDMQPVRSYKVRGALNSMLRAINQKNRREFVCASAGNHAQGVAYAARLTQSHAKIIMPTTTPAQKIDAVRRHGAENAQVVLHGTTYDEAYAHARSLQNGHYFIHAFDDDHVIAGQGTIALSLMDKSLDAILVPIGGGGLCAGLASAFEGTPTRVIGVQVQGATSMYDSLQAGYRTSIKQNTFVDGVGVSTPGEKNFSIIKRLGVPVVVVSEAQVCDALLSLYNTEGIVCELAGALSIAGLHALSYAGASLGISKGSRICCVVSGGNNDVRRLPAIIEKSSWNLEGATHKIYKR
ncbi:MAG TPA: pyridoxal-phosphate dependent enzyme [Acidobacteriota bacterium]|nr:pyridoxal-phosphate dependent enzyme [Acidobacteriota bacterium]